MGRVLSGRWPRRSSDTHRPLILSPHEPYDPDPLRAPDTDREPERPAPPDDGNPGMVVIYIVGAVLLLLGVVAVAALTWSRP